MHLPSASHTVIPSSGLVVLESAALQSALCFLSRFLCFFLSLILHPPPQHGTWIWPEKAQIHYPLWIHLWWQIHFLTVTSVLKHLAASGSRAECSVAAKRWMKNESGWEMLDRFLWHFPPQNCMFSNRRQYSVLVKMKDSGFRLNFFICKIEMRIVPIPRDCCENQMKQYS